MKWNFSAWSLGLWLIEWFWCVLPLSASWLTVQMFAVTASSNRVCESSDRLNSKLTKDFRFSHFPPDCLIFAPLCTFSGLTKVRKVTSASLIFFEQVVRPITDLFPHHEACLSIITCSKFCYLSLLHWIWTKSWSVCSGGGMGYLQWVESGLHKGILSYEKIYDGPHPLAPLNMARHVLVNTCP